MCVSMDHPQPILDYVVGARILTPGRRHVFGWYDANFHAMTGTLSSQAAVVRGAAVGHRSGYLGNLSTMGVL